MLSDGIRVTHQSRICGTCPCAQQFRRLSNQQRAFNAAAKTLTSTEKQRVHEIDCSSRFSPPPHLLASPGHRTQTRTIPVKTRAIATTTLRAAMDQSNDPADIKLTADIRKMVVGDDSLSMMAKDVSRLSRLMASSLCEVLSRRRKRKRPLRATPSTPGQKRSPTNSKSRNPKLRTTTIMSKSIVGIAKSTSQVGKRLWPIYRTTASFPLATSRS